MSTILDALRRVEEQLRANADQKAAGIPPSPHPPEQAPPVPAQGPSGDESDEAMKIYASLVEMVTRIEEHTQAMIDEERVATRKSIAELTSALTALQSNADQQAESPRADSQECDAARDKTDPSLASIQVEVNALKQGYTEAGKAVAALNSAISAVQAEAAAFRESHERETQEREAQGKETTSAFGSVQAEVNALKQGYAEAGKAVAALNSAIIAIQAEAAALRESHETQIQEREAQGKETVSAFGSVKAEVNALKQGYTEAGKAVAALNSAIIAVQAEATALRESHERETQEREAQEEKAASSLNAVQADVNALKQGYAEAGKAVAALSSAIGAVQAEAAALRESHETEIQERKGQEEKAASSLNAVQADVNALKQGYAEAGKAVGALNSAIMALQTRAMAQQELHDTEFQEHKADQEKMASAIARIRAEVHALGQGQAEADKDLREVIAEIRVLQSEAVAQNELVEEQIRQGATEQESIRSAMESLRSGLGALREECDTAQKTVERLEAAVGARRDNMAAQDELVPEETRQQQDERATDPGSLPATQSKTPPSTQSFTNADERLGELAEAMDAMRNELDRQRELLQEMEQRHNEERTATEEALAAIQSETDALRQLLSDRMNSGETPSPPVDKDEAQRLHTAAGEAFSRGDFAEALQYLDIINGAFPGNRSIIYNRAECLINLGRNEEARNLCEHLITALEYAPAEELKKRTLN